MSQVIKGVKLNMSQIFSDDGKVLPITWVKVESLLDGLIAEGIQVTITGKSKGKGYTGVVKKHGFRGGPATHGYQGSLRAPGSIGTDNNPARVLKGKKMAGRHGNKNVTLKNRPILKIEKNEDKVAIAGPIPGSYKSTIKIILNDEN